MYCTKAKAISGEAILIIAGIVLYSSVPTKVFVGKKVIFLKAFVSYLFRRHLFPTFSEVAMSHSR